MSVSSPQLTLLLPLHAQMSRHRLIYKYICILKRTRWITCMRAHGLTHAQKHTVITTAVQQPWRRLVWPGKKNHCLFLDFSLVLSHTQVITNIQMHHSITCTSGFWWLWIINSQNKRMLTNKHLRHTWHEVEQHTTECCGTKQNKITYFWYFSFEGAIRKNWDLLNWYFQHAGGSISPLVTTSSLQLLLAREHS